MADNRMSPGRRIDLEPRNADHHRMSTVGDIAARNVRALRAFRGWKQAELADALGWSPTKVADVESGRRRITADQLVELCRVFGVPLTRLLQDAEPDDLQVLGLARG